jgi:hypothetical protein
VLSQPSAGSLWPLSPLLRPSTSWTNVVATSSQQHSHTCHHTPALLCTCPACCTHALPNTSAADGRSAAASCSIANDTQQHRRAAAEPSPRPAQSPRSQSCALSHILRLALQQQPPGHAHHLAARSTTIHQARRSSSLPLLPATLLPIPTHICCRASRARHS